MAVEDKRNGFRLTLPDFGDVYFGKRLYVILEKAVNVNRKCTVCGGNKEVVLNGQTFQCPKCHGNTTGELWYDYKKYELKEYCVSELNFTGGTYIAEKAQNGVWDFNNPNIANGCEVKIVFRQVKYEDRFTQSFNFTINKGYSLKVWDYKYYTEHKDEFHAGCYSPSIFLDKSEAGKVQRELNAKEREGIKHYVEEAKRLKTDTESYSYKV